jgi:hypothetical protein
VDSRSDTRGFQRSEKKRSTAEQLRLYLGPELVFVDQANYPRERSLGTLCFLWEKRHIPIVLVGAKTLFDNFYQSKLTEDVRGRLTSRIVN